MAPIKSEFLKEELEILDGSVKTLEYSYQICNSIGIKNEFIQDNQSLSDFGVIGGPLYQLTIRSIKKGPFTDCD